MVARLPGEAKPALMANARNRRKRTQPSTLQSVATLIRDTDASLWAVLQNARLRDVTIGRLLEEAKLPPAVSSIRDEAVSAFQKYLTAREAQVAELVAQGDSNKEIGERLRLSAKTVKNHVSNILRKLALQRRTQIAIWALRRDRKERVALGNASRRRAPSSTADDG